MQRIYQYFHFYKKSIIKPKINNNNNNNDNMCRKFQFNHTNKQYMHNPAPVLENNSHKLLWDFDIQTGHLIPARRPDLIIINKKRESAKLSTLLSRRTTE